MPCVRRTCSLTNIVRTSVASLLTLSTYGLAHGSTNTPSSTTALVQIRAVNTEHKQGAPGTVSSSEREIVSPGPLYTLEAQDKHLFGTWEGIQPWLLQHGIHLDLGINEEFAGNVSGGRKQAYTNAGQIGLQLDIDWTKLANISGFWTHTIIVNGHGDNLSRHYGDSLASPQEIYGARGNVIAHLVALWGEKTLFNNHLDISAGWIPPGSFFAASPLYCDFMNVAICGNPAPSKYTPGTRDWPSGNLGTVAQLSITPQLYIMGGLFAVSPHSYNGGISGWAWAQDGLGKISTPVEIGWLPTFGTHKLMGHYKIGYSYDNSRYPHLYEGQNAPPYLLNNSAPRTVSGQNNLWIQGDQMLNRHGDGTSNGLILLGGAMYSDGRVVAMRDHEWVGAIDTGYAWNRPRDSIGVMWQHFDMSHSVILQQELAQTFHQPFQATQWGPVYGIQSHENTYEVFYSAHIARATALQPDFQYIQRPNATRHYRDVKVLGVQFTSVL
nr:carbohydrate porin [uncultured Neokomagataea sp.]